MIKRLKTRETFKLHLSKRFFFLFFFLDVFRLVTSVGQKKKSFTELKTSHLSYSIYRHDAINIADPRSMQDACHMNFVIDLAHSRASKRGIRRSEDRFLLGTQNGNEPFYF